MPGPIKNKTMPEAVQHAITALERLRDENRVKAEEVEPLLSGYALQLQKAGEEISVERLLDDAKKGADFIRQKNNPALKDKPRQKSYDEIVAFFKERDKKDPYAGLTINSQLNTACRLGDLKHVKYCLKSGADPNHANGQPIGWAAYYGHLDIVKHLHRHGGRLDADNNYALNQAAFGGHRNIVKYLFQNDISIFTDDTIVLRAAAVTGDLKMIKYLRRKGADLFVKDSTCIILAAQEGHLDVVKYLQKCGLDIHVRNDGAMLNAVARGQMHIIEYLHKNGTDLRKNKGFFLEMAARKSHVAAFDYLRRHGVRIKDLSDEDKQTVKEFQAQRRQWKKVAGREPLPYQRGLNPAYFKGDLYEKVHAILTKENPWDDEENLKRESWLNWMAYSLTAFFGSEEKILQYLERWGKDQEKPLFSITDRIELPRATTITDHDDFSKKIVLNLDAWRDVALKHGPTMAKLVKYADKIPAPYKSDDGKNWLIIKTKEEASKYAFNRAAEHPELARLCMTYDVKKKNFNAALNIVQKGAPAQKRLPNLTIDGKRFGMEGAAFKNLPPGDIRGLFLGEIVDCCQSIGGNGARCAAHGYSSKDGGFYVLEKEGKIIGEVWAWRGTKGELCFDSLEALKGEMNAEKWAKVLTCVKEDLIRQSRCGVSRLTVGTGGETPAELKNIFKKSARLAKMRHYKRYGDSKEQLLIWKRGR